MNVLVLSGTLANRELEPCYVDIALPGIVSNTVLKAFLGVSVLNLNHGGTDHICWYTVTAPELLLSATYWQ
jgi:hypothetical protein